MRRIGGLGKPADASGVSSPLPGDTSPVPSSALRDGGFSFSVALPWPPRALWPNGRPAHWAIKAREAKAAKRIGLALGLQRGPIIPPGVPLAVAITSHKPTRVSRYDDDNLIAALKHYLDGLALALGVDDSRFRLQAPVRGAPRGAGEIVVEVATFGG